MASVFGNCTYWRTVMRVTWQPAAPECSPVDERPCFIPATIREGWTKPTAPDGYVLATYWTGDGWWTHFYRADDGDCIDVPGDVGWPFVEDFAASLDWTGAGFTVI